MTKKNEITRADALRTAINMFDENAPERIVLGKMLDSITKPRKKSNAPSRARIENEQILNAAIEKMPTEPINTKWLTENVRGIMTTQKAAAIMRLGVEMGKVRKIVDGRNVSYTVA